MKTVIEQLGCFKRLALALMLLLMVALGCAHKGTLVTVETVSTQVVKATDQAVLADAIDAAYEQIDIAGMRAKLQSAGPVTAYLQVAAPFDLPRSMLDYIEQRAALTAGQLNLSVLEVQRTRTRSSPEHNWEFINEVFPETDARVLMLVSYAGVDEIETQVDQKTHASSGPDRILKGRFKGTFAVTPRNRSFQAVLQTISGDTEIKIADGDYIDAR